MADVELKTCPSCDGDGWLATSHKYTCTTCRGTGKLAPGPDYDAAVETEKQIAANLARSVSAWEYRAMGG